MDRVACAGRPRGAQLGRAQHFPGKWKLGGSDGFFLTAGCVCIKIGQCKQTFGLHKTPKLFEMYLIPGMTPDYGCWIGRLAHGAKLGRAERCNGFLLHRNLFCCV